MLIKSFTFLMTNYVSVRVKLLILCVAEWATMYLDLLQDSDADGSLFSFLIAFWWAKSERGVSLIEGKGLKCIVNGSERRHLWPWWWYSRCGNAFPISLAGAHQFPFRCVCTCSLSLCVSSTGALILSGRYGRDKMMWRMEIQTTILICKGH